MARDSSPSSHPNHCWPSQTRAQAGIKHTKDRLRFTESVRLYKFDELPPLQPSRWLIDELLPEKALAVLDGAQGVRKSFLALHLAMSVAAGFDRSSPEPRRVFYVTDCLATLNKRVQGWMRVHRPGIVPSDFYVVEAPQIGRNESLTELAHSLREFDRRPTLIVIDVGTTVNDVAGLRELATQSAVLVVTPKRGNRALREVAQTTFRLSEDHAGTLTLQNTKQRDHARSGPRSWRAQVVPLEGGANGEAQETTLVLVPEAPAVPARRQLPSRMAAATKAA